MFFSRAVNPFARTGRVVRSLRSIVSISPLLGIEFEFRIEWNGMEWDGMGWNGIETKRNGTRAVGWARGGKKIVAPRDRKMEDYRGKGGREEGDGARREDIASNREGKFVQRRTR